MCFVEGLGDITCHKLSLSMGLYSVVPNICEIIWSAVEFREIRNGCQARFIGFEVFYNLIVDVPIFLLFAERCVVG